MWLALLGFVWLALFVALCCLAVVGLLCFVALLCRSALLCCFALSLWFVALLGLLGLACRGLCPLGGGRCFTNPPRAAGSPPTAPGGCPSCQPPSDMLLGVHFGPTPQEPRAARPPPLGGLQRTNPPGQLPTGVSLGANCFASLNFSPMMPHRANAHGGSFFNLQDVLCCAPRRQTRLVRRR